MADASKAQEFERAGLYRDRLRAVKAMLERQQVATDSVGTADLIGVAAEGTDANAQVFQVRDGILAERQSFYLENQGERDLAEVAEEFLAQYYSAAPAAPKTIIVGPELSERAELIAEGLSAQRSDARSRCASPSAATSAGCARWPSATRALPSRRTSCAASIAATAASRRSPSCSASWGWSGLPVRIEGFDISNTGPDHTVASMVVFEGGASKKGDYRRFNIRGERERGPDDFASMEEVLGRRVARYLEQADLSPHDAERDESFASLPAWS